MPQATAAPPLVKSSGRGFRSPSARGIAAQTFGQLIKKSCPTSSTRRVGKRLGKRPTSSVGITPYDNGWPDSCVRPCRFPSRKRCTSFVCDFFFIATISRLPPPAEPLPGNAHAAKSEVRKILCGVVIVEKRCRPKASFVTPVGRVLCQNLL